MGEIAPRVVTAKDKDFCHNLRKYFREFTEVTGIHGLRYVSEKRSRTEKVIWVIILLISLGGCIYMIYEVLDKYNKSPVVVSFATEDTPLYQIAFPAVTICPESKYSREKFNYSGVYSKLVEEESVTIDERRKFDYLSMLCDDSPDNVATTQNFGNEFYEIIHKMKLNQSELFPLCIFDNKFTECDRIFTPIFIDEGICYSFNIQGAHEIFRDHVYNFKDYYKVSNNSEKYFDPEFGYRPSAGVHTYPRRALRSGADSAFGIFFNYDTADTDFNCKNFLQGFRVLIHNSSNVPRVSEHYFRIPFDKVVVAAMEPVLVVTSQNVRGFRPEKRKCFMRNERFLKHFLYYSQPNCMLECLTNYTLAKCGCVQFYMPRDNSTLICGPNSEQCTENAESEMQIKDLEYRISGRSLCDCKPTCTNMKYNVETSHSDFYFKEYFKVHNEFNLGDGGHWSVLQLYFKDEQFMTMERNELYGISDLISNLGGLLGLFTGFSLVTMAEIIYFCSLRVVYNRRLYGLWSGPN
ncbi:Pickpocket protein 28-like Protein [Tribolium castaneum]|uniref:Pickpocket protein 28-like Protein n=1 Tax=Tribolium castaneum TaxID=7070 RepID=D6WXM8_TRICA|nr:PREDICTED: pickpocket protein 28 [Tribolium castaneum]EFA07961.1 Pickpocket protein 28-like Protein [Tribolium castaneum]|eukprot:XP_972442.2 PREDICTED: pickpocket protein 28 [Tribolium castaneum]